MEIIFFRHSLLSRGGDKMVVAHANHLLQQGNEVVIQSNLVRSVFSLEPGIRIERMPLKGKLGTLLSAFLGKTSGDLIIADIIPLACLLGLRHRRKVLYFAQDFDESYYHRWWQQWLIRGLYKLGLSRLKLPAVCVSSHLASILKERFGADVIMVQNGVDTEIFYPEADDELVSLKEDRKAVLVFSRSDRRKGFDLVAQILQKVESMTEVPFEVWSVGEAPGDSFDRLTHRNFGYVDEAKLRKLLSSADLFLYPSRHEGFPLFFLEAVACGCPVVTTEAVTMATDREDSLVRPVEDIAGLAAAVEEVLTDESLARRLKGNGLSFAREHSLLKSKERFSHVVNSLFCNPGKGKGGKALPSRSI